MNINIPENHKQLFDSSIEYAINQGLFTPDGLARHLGTGVFVASIMVGYMEKSEVVTKGKGNDVRRARLTAGEWEAIGRDLSAYVPKPEPEPEVFEAPEPEETAESEFEFNFPIPTFINKTLTLNGRVFTLTDSDTSFNIPCEDIAFIYFHKGTLFSKGTLSLSAERISSRKVKGRADTLVFSRKENGSVWEFALALAEKLGIEVRSMYENTR